MRGLLRTILLLVLGKSLRIIKMRRGLFRGIRLKIDPARQLFLMVRDIEPYLQKIMKKHIKHNDIVFDIGSNIGYTSIAMSKIVGDSGLVYAFEPVPTNIDDFKTNIALNKCNNITLISKALSNVNEITNFRIPEMGKNLSMASMIWHKKDDSVLTLQLETIILDEDQHLKDLTPSFIKIDVEGSEGKVILGIQNLIKRSRPVIFIECSKNGRENVWKVLKDLNYHCFNSKDIEILDINDYRSNDFLWIPVISN